MWDICLFCPIIRLKHLQDSPEGRKQAANDNIGEAWTREYVLLFLVKLLLIIVFQLLIFITKVKLEGLNRYFAVTLRSPTIQKRTPANKACAQLMYHNRFPAAVNMAN